MSFENYFLLKIWCCSCVLCCVNEHHDDSVVHRTIYAPRHRNLEWAVHTLSGFHWIWKLACKVQFSSCQRCFLQLSSVGGESIWRWARIPNRSDRNSCRENKNSRPIPIMVSMILSNAPTWKRQYLPILFLVWSSGVYSFEKFYDNNI